MITIVFHLLTLSFYFGVQRVDAILFWMFFSGALDKENEEGGICNRYCKFALGEVLYMLKSVMPKILEEDKQKDYQERFHMMGAIENLFLQTSRTIKQT